MTGRTVHLVHRAALVLTLALVGTNTVLAARGVIDVQQGVTLYLCVELPLGLLVLAIGVLRVRALRHSDASWSQVLDEIAGRTPAALLRMELRSYRALWWLARRRRVGEGPGVTAIGHTRGTLAVPIALLVASLVEMTAVHLLVPWEWLRWTLLIVSLYSLLPLAGLLADRIVHPHLVTADEFVLRSGHQVIARIDPRDVQRCIPRRRFDRTEAGVDDDTLFLPGPDGTVLDLVLAQPIEVLLPAFLEHRRRRAHVQRIALHVDDPAAARAALTPVSARSRGSSRR
ncbi:hypothetical protein OED52_02500 [Rhodococcus sp. Z13]|uniref:Uncharacterized protein n=1 Tax=Rhodococcus sacchari TaxID=2962047 RepID=A0ACD4DHF2_9NOCA|nr:hypothetical protein [Rhodococcus sp. Z13]UYP19461.1 hypothetical protein OED52_02500 [Rhodococcus sp. Z13]